MTNRDLLALNIAIWLSLAFLILTLVATHQSPMEVPGFPVALEGVTDA